MKIKEIMNEAKNEIKGEVQSAAKGISSLLTIAGWIIGIFLLIGLFTGTLQNVVDNLFLKHYYIYEVKSMDSPDGQGTLKDFVNLNFANVKWDFEREDDEKIVSVSGIESGTEWIINYSINDGYIKFKDMTADGQPLENYIDNKIDSILSGDVEIESNNNTISDQEVSPSYYNGTELNYKYSTYIEYNIEDLDLSDTEKLKEIILESKFVICPKYTIGDALENDLKDIEYDIYQTEKGTSIVAKGNSKSQKIKLTISILLKYDGKLYLDTIRSGENNTLLDIDSQIKIADKIFNS